MKFIYLTFIISLFFNLNAMAQLSIHEFKVESIDGDKIKFSDYKGKKILVVNTASQCGFTKQYAQLQELYDSLGEKLVIVGFPANNFGSQEPGSNEEIGEFCQKNYGVTFPLAAKVSVKGDDQHELFTWLCSRKNPDFGGKIRWNFEKFLLDEDGILIHRYRSGVEPMSEEIIGAL
ncbi:MAG: glutathione peroxidase [Flavobacteriales bacterium]|nr:glutathione peroxidase [Flavobacteriales bacterium]